MKNLQILLALASMILLQIACQQSPCKPGWVEPEDCLTDAIDPEKGNCYWAELNGSCIAVECDTVEECAENCYQCLMCLYNYGCCTHGSNSNYYTCFSNSAP